MRLFLFLLLTSLNSKNTTTLVANDTHIVQHLTNSIRVPYYDALDVPVTHFKTLANIPSSFINDFVLETLLDSEPTLLRYLLNENLIESDGLIYDSSTFFGPQLQALKYTVKRFRINRRSCKPGRCVLISIPALPLRPEDLATLVVDNPRSTEKPPLKTRLIYPFYVETFFFDIDRLIDRLSRLIPAPNPNHVVSLTDQSNDSTKVGVLERLAIVAAVVNSNFNKNFKAFARDIEELRRKVRIPQLQASARLGLTQVHKELVRILSPQQGNSLIEKGYRHLRISAMKFKLSVYISDLLDFYMCIDHRLLSRSKYPSPKFKPHMDPDLQWLPTVSPAMFLNLAEKYHYGDEAIKIRAKEAFKQTFEDVTDEEMTNFFLIKPPRSHKIAIGIHYFTLLREETLDDSKVKSYTLLIRKHLLTMRDLLREQLRIGTAMLAQSQEQLRLTELLTLAQEQDDQSLRQIKLTNLKLQEQVEHVKQRLIQNEKDIHSNYKRFNEKETQSDENRVEDTQSDEMRDEQSDENRVEDTQSDEVRDEQSDEMRDEQSDEMRVDEKETQSNYKRFNEKETQSNYKRFNEKETQSNYKRLFAEL